jgi:glyoxylase-like metal-dependent hydrolase (beta-lactamase superfamily II)
VLAVTMVGLALPAAAQPDPAQVEVKVVPVAAGVWMLQAGGGNIGVSAGADGVFLVDDEYAPLTPKVRAAVATISERPVRFVLNTHWHPDHSGGNENLGEAGAVVVAHDNVRRRLSEEQFIAVFDLHVPPAPAGALPLVTFADGVTFHVNGDTLEATYLPAAHTDGDVAVRWHTADVIHAGDLFFNGMYPAIDLSSGGSIDGLIAATAELLAAAGDGTRIIPGHGAVAGRAELAAYHAMLRGVRDAVAALVAAGRTRDEAVAAKPTAPWDEAWGGGLIPADLMTAIVYDSLAGS